jgi:hypothetical protein
MILRITEYCAWENERWSYIIDLTKQDATAINSLMIFIRCANAHFEEVRTEAERQPPALAYHPLFNRHPRNPFAASSYVFNFYDTAEHDGEKGKLTCAGKTIWVSDQSGYHKFINFMLDRKISVARMKSAMIAMRDKKENKLYKSFENIFLSPKRKPATEI